MRNDGEIYERRIVPVRNAKQLNEPHTVETDLADGGVGRLAIELLVDESADLLVLDKEAAVGGLGGIPAALPVLRDADAEPGWTYLLTHVSVRPFRGCSKKPRQATSSRPLPR